MREVDVTDLEAVLERIYAQAATENIHIYPTCPARDG
jgi:hypothetical protein